MRQRYAMLLAPSANRVYARDAPRMTSAEIGVFADRLLDGRVENLEATAIAGIPYLVFEASDLSDRDLRCLANLSALYALFKVHGPMLEPVALRRLDRYDDDLVTILKYTGKTNEQFTRLLLNVTAAAAISADRYLEGSLRVLDPMAGRGTTLNQAVMFGWDASGVEIDKRDFEAYAAFIQRWLKSKSLKHRAEQSRLKREGRSLGQRLKVEFAASKERYRAGEVQSLEMVNADTLDSAKVFRKRSFDLVVADAPYGVRHAAVNTARALSRSPGELLEAAIPGWAELLRSGGALGLSWNTLVLPREELEAMLAGAGLDVVDDEPYLGFAHRVDQAINRDLVVARRP
ncbi:TRM11 family methyltransferase [Glycomyces sp. NRRL B-16210]|uniref:TRM11 family SAM-dependent methyltransferase n=1 Tax=Glycomyces sp. NRRL B-16210 TaxID=1463821 RepID=UPI000B16D153|nr:hypothetical protein [Glycomyces sp. NRRL B-16210]